ncbi:MAG: DUF3189 family protein [Clostridia bacterium]|nr:DUF3189 family protein [Clostridia bacterium]
MHIIYHCYGGAHSSVTAAGIHLGLITDETIPTPEEILALPFYDQPKQEDHGYLRFLGEDQKGNKIYIIGRRGLKNSFPTLVQSLGKLLGIPSEELLVVDTVPYVNWMMVLGGFTSRRLDWVSLGRPLVIRGTRKAFKKFVQLVHKVRIQCEGGTTH